jgi:hypothetical protein
VVLMLQPALGQAPDLSWEKSFGGPGDERGISLLETADSSLAVVATPSSKGDGGRGPLADQDRFGGGAGVG